MGQAPRPNVQRHHSPAANRETLAVAGLARDAVRALGQRYRPRYRAKRTAEAAALTAALARRQRELDSVLTDYLADPPPGIDMDTLKKPLPPAPPLDPKDAEARPAPTWENYAPPSPRGLGKVFGAGAYARQRTLAAQVFAMAVDNYEAAEGARRKRVTQIRNRHAEAVARIREQHANIDRFVVALQSRERKAVSRYFQQVLDQLRDPDGLPAQRRTGYLPESGLLAVEWQLPTIDVVPKHAAYAFQADRNTIAASSRPEHERRRSYQRLIAQLALRAVHAVIGADRYAVVDTIVFNGVADGIDPVSRRPVRPCLISLRTTPHRFTALELSTLDPAACAREQLAAKVSAQPERLQSVEPVLDFAHADPRRIHRARA